MNVREKLVELLKQMGKREREEGGVTWYDVADHLIANGVTINDWISVEDRLPEESTRVWVFGGRKNEVEVMRYRRDADGECRFYWEDELGLLSAWYKYRVTHWMPLPKSPGADMRGDA